MKGLVFAVLAAVALCATPALAESGKDIVMSGTKAGAPACSSCHGMKGEGQPGAGIPRLAGMNVHYLLYQLQSFADGTRKNDIMTPIASTLSDRERKAVTAYYAGLKPAKPEPKAPSNPAELAAGAALAINGDWSQGVPGCSQCHGAKGEGVGTNFPRLAGQYADYIEAQLKAFKTGSRSNAPMHLMRSIAAKLSDAQITAVAAYYAAMPGVHVAPAPPPPARSKAANLFTPPPDSAIPDNQFGKMVTLGRNIFRDTQHYAHAYVGNGLDCRNCHLNDGRLAGSAPLWAAYVSYPAYRSKNKHVNTYGERLQGCFRYSMNGKVPALGSKPLVALEAYSYFLAKGAPVGDSKMKGRGYPKLKTPAKPVSYARGQAIYASHCALCHGANGQGQRAASGAMTFPPLWGPKSFNWGAGMGNIKNAAGFIKANMPFSQGLTLTDQQAWDVATFVDSHERPQDPRFTGNVAETRRKYHNSATWMYGKRVNGVLLGAHSVPSGPR